MIIDLSDWNEYIADDVPPGAIPCGIRLQVMIVTSYDGDRDTVKCCPTAVKADRNTVNYRMFWKIKDDN